MKGLTKTAPREGALELRDWAEPVAGPGEVVIAVEAAGICGTDLSIYKWAEALAQAYKWPVPLLLGHEFAGRVAAVGLGVEGLAVGDAVSANPILNCGRCYFCQAGRSEICDDRPLVGQHLPGAFASHTKVRASNVIKVPDGVPLDRAALAEPLAVALHAVQRVRLQPGETVAVVGAGPIGLLAALAARVSGAEQVIVTGLSRDATRLAIARELGCTTLDAEQSDAAALVREATGGRGADVVMEAGGHPSAVKQAVSLARKGGRIGLMGLPHYPTELSTSALALDEKELVGCRAYTMQTWRQVQALLPTVHPQLALIISHRIPLDEGVEAFRLAQSGEGVKILLLPAGR